MRVRPHLLHAPRWLVTVAIAGAVVAGISIVLNIIPIALSIAALVKSVDNSGGATPTLPGNLARLTDPAAVCTGLLQQSGTAATCVPFVGENATFNIVLSAIGTGAPFAVDNTSQVRGLHVNSPHTAVVAGDDVLLTIAASAPPLCGACGAGATVHLATNATCLECHAPVANAPVLCGPCTAGNALRLHSNGTCLECYVLPASTVLGGGGAVGVLGRTNDTQVYTHIWSWMPEPYTIQTASIHGFLYLSGSAQVSTYPKGYPGFVPVNPLLANATAYQLEVIYEALLFVDNSTTTPVLLTSLTPLIPESSVFALVTPAQYVSYAHVTCADSHGTYGASLVPIAVFTGPGMFSRTTAGIDVYYYLGGMATNITMTCSFHAHLNFVM